MISGSILPPITPPGLHPKLLSEGCAFPSGPVIRSSILDGQSHLSLAVIVPITRKSGFALLLRSDAKYFGPLTSPTKVRAIPLSRPGPLRSGPRWARESWASKPAAAMLIATKSLAERNLDLLQDREKMHMS